jgi:hypothetical protein
LEVCGKAGYHFAVILDDWVADLWELWTLEQDGEREGDFRVGGESLIFPEAAAAWSARVHFIQKVLISSV